MKDIYLADAHLRSPADSNYRLLLNFLEEERGQLRTLFLLGDIFDFWIGYPHVVFSPSVPLLEAFRRLREGGTEIVYVEGNHDFHLGPYFRDVLGCRILPDGGAVERDGKKIFLTHGDLINRKDRMYRLLRGLLRSKPLRIVMHIVPPDWTWKISRWSSRRSRLHAAERRRRSPEKLLQAHARERFAEGFDAVISGHFHIPLQQTTEAGTMIALGDWIEQFSYAVWEDGRFSLERYYDRS